MVKMGDHTVKDIKHEIEQAAVFIGMVSFRTEDETASHFIDMAMEKAEKALSLLNAQKSDNDTPEPRRSDSASGKHMSW